MRRRMFHWIAFAWWLWARGRNPLNRSSSASRRSWAARSFCMRVSGWSFVAASTTKLLTEGTALSLLRPDYRFHVRVYRTGDSGGGGRSQPRTRITPTIDAGRRGPVSSSVHPGYRERRRV